jgi:large subunit ribosomal protein L10
VTREEKVESLAELRESLGRARAAVLTDFRGLSVADMTDLRRHLRKSSVRYHVVKNTLAKRAVEDTPLAGLARYFVGPTGVAVSHGDPLAAAKAIMTWAKGRPTFSVKAGVVEGAVLETAELQAVAALPGREQLLSQLLSVLQAPIRNLASVLQGQIRAAAAVLDQVRQQKEGSHGG